MFADLLYEDDSDDEEPLTAFLIAFAALFSVLFETGLPLLLPVEGLADDGEALPPEGLAEEGERNAPLPPEPDTPPETGRMP